MSTEPFGISDVPTEVRTDGTPPDGDRCAVIGDSASVAMAAGQPLLFTMNTWHKAEDNFPPPDEVVEITHPRRRARGVEAVRIEIQWNDEYSESLWMSRRDLVMNIKEFGEDPALMRGLQCYSPNVKDEPRGQQKDNL